MPYNLQRCDGKWETLVRFDNTQYQSLSGFPTGFRRRLGGNLQYSTLVILGVRKIPLRRPGIKTLSNMLFLIKLMENIAEEEEALQHRIFLIFLDEIF
jgi:hypothetical protein